MHEPRDLSRPDCPRCYVCRSAIERVHSSDFHPTDSYRREYCSLTCHQVQDERDYIARATGTEPPVTEYLITSGQLTALIQPSITAALIRRK